MMLIKRYLCSDGKADNRNSMYFAWGSLLGSLLQRTYTPSRVRDLARSARALWSFVGRAIIMPQSVRPELQTQFRFIFHVRFVWCRCSATTVCFWCWTVQRKSFAFDCYFDWTEMHSMRITVSKFMGNIWIGIFNNYFVTNGAWSQLLICLNWTHLHH